MAKIKICGLKRLEDIEIVNKYKPDYIGFVFADSKRKVTSDLACKMKKNLDSSIKSVGVFVDEDIDVIIKLYDEGIIDIAQLHGLENEEYIKKLKQKSNTRLKTAIPPESGVNFTSTAGVFPTNSSSPK